MKKFVNPDIEISVFEAEDVITTSSCETYVDCENDTLFIPG